MGTAPGDDEAVIIAATVREYQAAQAAGGKRAAAPIGVSVHRKAPPPQQQAPEQAEQDRQRRRLREAALAGDASTVDLLLRGSTIGRRPRPPVEPDAAASDGWTPLHCACVAGQLAAVELLLKHGADVHAATQLGDTALTLVAAAAAECGDAEDEARAEIAALLLGAGADLGAANREGNNALHRAALQGAWGVSRVLLQHGAPPELRNRVGRAATELCADDNPVRELIVQSQLSPPARQPVSLDGSGRLDDGSEPRQSSGYTSPGTPDLRELSETVIDRHFCFKGVPSWERERRVSSRLGELSSGRPQSATQPVALRKLNVPGTVDERAHALVAEGQGIRPKGPPQVSLAERWGGEDQAARRALMGAIRERGRVAPQVRPPQPKTKG